MSTTNTTKSKPLYTFNWKSGGYNQVYARTKREALEEVKRQFGRTPLEVNLKTLRRLSSPAAIKNYWDNFPLFD